MSKGIMGKASLAVRALRTRRIEFEFEKIPICLPNSDYGRILNWLRVESSIALRRGEAGEGRPTFLQVEPSTLCNLSCPFCPTSHHPEERRGNMELELFKKVIDDVGRHTLLIELWGWGEPFVNPAIYDMIGYARGKGIRLVSSSNGELFARGNHAEGVVRSGLDALIVTLGGITAETNEISRAGGSLERVFEGVRNIVAQKRLRGSDTPWVSLTFIAMEYNEHEIPKLREVAQSLGVNMVNVKKMNPSSTQSDIDGRDRMLPREERLRRFSYDEKGRHRLLVKRNPCKVLWHCPTIRWDGRVNACAFDFHGDYHMGDLAEGTLRKFWFGRDYREMRRRFREDWKQLPLCGRCTYAFEGGDYGDVFAESHVFAEGGQTGDGRRGSSGRVEL